MIGDVAAALLRRRADGLAAAAVQRLGARVAQRWASFGAVANDGDTLRLRGARRVRRDAISDADLLWPGERK